MKISKTQAEAAYNVLVRKINKLKSLKSEKLIKSFPKDHPKYYSMIKEYVECIEKQKDLYKQSNKIKYLWLYNPCDYTIEYFIERYVKDSLDDKYHLPNRSEFIDNLLILGDTDINKYIENCLKSYNK